MQAADLLNALVQIPSPSGHERAAAECLRAWLTKHDFNAALDEVGNAVGTRGTGANEILLLGHIDTVPGMLPIRRENGRLYGRGTVDAKGALAAFATAAAQCEIPETWRLTVVGAVEEESATSRGARHILAQRVTPPRYCIIGEPSRWNRVTIGYRGRLLAAITLQAPLAHSAGPEQLPAEQAVALWERIRRDCDAGNAERGAKGVFESIGASLRHIASHDQDAYGLVEMTVGFRLPPGVAPETWQTRLETLLHLGAAADREDIHAAAGTTTDLRCYGAEPAYRGKKSNALVRALLAAIRETAGTPRFVVKSGTSDMNVVGAHWPQLPMVAYGPGNSALDHTPDEHIDLAELKRATAVLKTALTTLMDD